MANLLFKTAPVGETKLRIAAFFHHNTRPISHRQDEGLKTDHLDCEIETPAGAGPWVGAWRA